MGGVLWSKIRFGDQQRHLFHRTDSPIHWGSGRNGCGSKPYVHRQRGGLNHMRERGSFLSIASGRRFK